MTPAAKSEIAIGMKTAVLNATDQLTRSVMTAKMRPIAVTSAGYETDPDRVVLDRGNVVGSCEEALVVVEPDEVLAGAVVEAPDERPDGRIDDPEREEESREAEEQECDANSGVGPGLRLAAEPPQPGAPP